MDAGELESAPFAPEEYCSVFLFPPCFPPPRLAPLMWPVPFLNPFATVLSELGSSLLIGPCGFRRTEEAPGPVEGGVEEEDED